MVTTKLNLSMTEPQVRQIYAKQGDTGRVLDITLDQTPEDGTLRILRPDGVEVTSEANLASDTYNVQTTPYYSGETTDLGMVMGTIEGKSEQFVLPSGYQAVEYIQSTGHEYINTGFVPTSDDGFEIDFISNNDFASSGNYGCILGARTSSNTLDFQLTTWAQGQTGTLRWGTNNAHEGGLLERGTRQKAKLCQKTYTAPNGNTWSFTSNYTGAYPLYVFSLNQAGSATQNGSVILYSLKLYRSADLAMYLIPCKRTSDNKLGLYDVVGGTFLPVVNIDSSANPQGGGNVTLPNPTNPLPINSFSTTEFVSEGKNLLDNTVKSGQTLTSNGVSCTINSDGSVTVSGTATGGAINAWFVGNYGIVHKVKRFVAGTYTFTDFLPFYHYIDETNLRSVTVTFASRSATFTFTKDWWLDGVRCPAAETGTEYNLTLYPQIEFGSTVTSFEPYQSSTASASLTLRSLPDGTCDTYENGVVTRRVGVVRLDGTLNYRNPDSAGSCYIDKHDMKRMTNYADSILCDSLKARSSRYMSSYAYGISGYEGAPTTFEGQNWLYFKVDEITASTEMKEFFTNNPAYAYYPLATPTTETVTIPTLVTYENYTYVHNDSEVDPPSIEYKAIMLESGQVAIPSEATEIVGKCYCDVEQNGVSSMPFTLNVKKNERES